MYKVAFEGIHNVLWQPFGNLYHLLSTAVISAFHSSWQVPQSCQGYLAVNVDVGRFHPGKPGSHVPASWMQHGERKSRRESERGYTEESFFIIHRRMDEMIRLRPSVSFV